MNNFTNNGTNRRDLKKIYIFIIYKLIITGQTYSAHIQVIGGWCVPSRFVAILIFCKITFVFAFQTQSG